MEQAASPPSRRFAATWFSALTDAEVLVHMAGLVLNGKVRPFPILVSGRK